MLIKDLSFDEVFKVWLDNEIGQVGGRDLLPVAKAKGFSTVIEWRLASALRLGLNDIVWSLESIEQPQLVLPSVIIGPYKGWSQFFKNELQTTFAQALEIPEFLSWCHTHDRVIPLSRRFPMPTTLILLRKGNGDLIHVEGGHRMCAVAYAQKMGQPIQFPAEPVVFAAIASVEDAGIPKLLDFLSKGSDKQ